LVFGVIYLTQGDLVSGFVEIGLALMLFLNIWFLRYSHNIEQAENIGLFILSLALIFLFYTGGINNTGIFWFFIYPGIAFFLKGVKKGNLWQLSLFLVILILVLLGLLHILEL